MCSSIFNLSLALSVHIEQLYSVHTSRISKSKFKASRVSKHFIHFFAGFLWSKMNEEDLIDSLIEEEDEEESSQTRKRRETRPRIACWDKFRYRWLRYTKQVLQ